MEVDAYSGLYHWFGLEPVGEERTSLSFSVMIPADGEHGDTVPEAALDQPGLDRVSLGHVAAVGLEVTPAREDDSVGVDLLDQPPGLVEPVREDQRSVPEPREQGTPALIQGVPPLTMGVDDDSLGDRDHETRRTSTRRLAQSMCRSAARDSCSKRRGPAPITAGMPSSLARMAMWEFTPP